MSQPQPAPYPPQPHSHDKFIAAIIIGVVVTAVVAGGIGYGLGSVSRALGTSPQPQQPSFTYTHGTVDISSKGTALAIYFDNQVTGTLTSAVASQAHNYQLYLPSDKTYTMTIYYNTALSGIQSCTARPGIFTTSGSDYTQDFVC